MPEGKRSTFFNALKKRNETFVKHQLCWNNNPNYPLWNKEYSDSNTHRCIIKVDSHQLNREGTQIKNYKPRHNQLVPNLALLSANYFADATASTAIEIHKEAYKDNTNNLPANILFPTSDMRYGISYDNALIDKQQSTFIRERLEDERIYRMQTKEYQGVLFRLKDHILQSPLDIGRKSGYRRFITNLSKSHSRACYKSKQYLALNILEANDTEEGDKSKQFFDLLQTKSLLKDNKHILVCKHCNSQQYNEDSPPRGNRRHFTLFCQNARLKTFRNDMTGYIEQLAKQLYQQAEDIGGEGKGTELFKVINDTLSNPNLQKLGKRNPNSTPPKNYLQTQEWCTAINSTDLHASIQSNSIILQNILGFNTATPDNSIEDNDMGLVDFIYLGLIPTTLHDTILNFIKEITKSICINEKRLELVELMSKTWKRIRGAIKARNLGLHRIVGELTTDREIELRKKYHIPKSSKCNKMLEELKKEETKLDEQKSQQMKVCKGPSCIITNNITSNPNSKPITPNQIKITHRQCARCINLDTALKRKNIILNIILEKGNSEQMKKIADIFVLHQCTKLLTGNLLQIILDINGQITPWLTQTNILPQKGRGIKINAKKPADLALNEIQKAMNLLQNDRENLKQCKFCINNNIPTTKPNQTIQNATKNSAIKHCPICWLSSSIKAILHPDTNTIINDSQATNIHFHNTSNTPRKRKLAQMEANIPNISSPLIRANMKNHINSLKPSTPKKQKQGSTVENENIKKVNISNSATKRKLRYRAENQSVNQDIPHQPPDITTLHKPGKVYSQKNDKNSNSKLKSESSIDNKKETKKRQNNIADSTIRDAKKIRLQHNITRSNEMNFILEKIRTFSCPQVYIANTNMLSYTKAWNISEKDKIPDNINFTSTAARQRQPGVYLFPTYLGTFHNGFWITVCLEKTKEKNNNINGWLINPKTGNYTDEITSIQEFLCTKIFFNRKIIWNKLTDCTPLQETECGARSISACCIIGVGKKYNLDVQTLVLEAAHLPISEQEHSSFLTRELAFTIIGGTKEETILERIFSEDLQKLFRKKQETKISLPWAKSQRVNTNNKKTRRCNQRKKKERIKKSQKQKTKKDLKEKSIASIEAKHKLSSLGISNKSITDIPPPTQSIPSFLSLNITKSISINQQKQKYQGVATSRNNGIPIKSNTKHEKKTRNLWTLGSSSNIKTNTKPTKNSIQARTNNSTKPFKYDLESLVEGMDDDIISSIGNNSVTKKSLKKLRPGQWLNDEIIHAFLGILNGLGEQPSGTIHDCPKIHFFNSFFMTALGSGTSYNFDRAYRWTRRLPQNSNIFDLDILAFPVNINMSHWVLIVIDFRNKQIEFCDSLGNAGVEHLQSVMSFILDEHSRIFNSPLPNRNIWNLKSWGNTIIQQPNAFDCGVFVCIYAETLIRGSHPRKISRITENPRYWLLHSIMDKRITQNMSIEDISNINII